MVAAFNRLNRYVRRYKDSQLPYNNTQKEKKKKKKKKRTGISDPSWIRVSFFLFSGIHLSRGYILS